MLRKKNIHIGKVKGTVHECERRTKVARRELTRLISVDAGRLNTVRQRIGAPAVRAFMGLLGMLNTRPGRILGRIVPLAEVRRASMIRKGLRELAPGGRRDILQVLSIVVRRVVG